MKKIALFVEGQTEQIFAEKLIHEMAGRHKVAIKTYKFSGGKNTARNLLLLASNNVSGNSDVFI